MLTYWRFLHFQIRGISKIATGKQAGFDELSLTLHAPVQGTQF